MSLEFIRQGKNAEETATLIKNSMMMSKLANMSSVESTEALTAIMNGYKLSAEETGSVVDRLVSIDNIAATSVKELSTAMQYSSATAQQVGIDFDHLAAYIGVVSSTTRLSAQTIGQAFKTISARMTAIKDMKTFDEEGEAINNVEKALMGVDVKLRDSNGQFRDMQDVLDELTNRWSEFSTENQMFIAQQIGGVRQQNIVLSLLNNEIELQKQLNAEKESTGLTQERYAIYQKSVEAAQSRMTASWEDLWMTTIESGFISWLYDSGAAALDLVNDLGGLLPILSQIGVALIAFQVAVNWAEIAKVASSALYLITGTAWNFVYAMGAGATVSEAFAVALYSIPVAGWIALAASAVIVAISWISSLDTATEKLYKLNEELRKNQEEMSALRDKAQSIEELFQKYKSLTEEQKKLSEAKSLDEKETKRLSEATKELTDVQNKLKELVPELAVTYDKFGNAIISEKVSHEDLTKAIYDEIEAKRKLKQVLADEAAGTVVEGAVEAANNKMMTLGKTDAQIAKDNAEWATAVRETKEAFYEAGVEGRADIIKGLLESKGSAGASLARDLGEELQKELNKMALELGDSLEGDDWISRMLPRKPKEPIELITLNDTDFYEKVDGIKKSFGELDDALLKIGQGESISEQLTLLDLLGVGWENVNGKIVVSEEEINRWQQEQVDALSSGIKITKEQEGAINQLNDSITNSIGGVQLTRSAYVYAANDISSAFFNESQKAGFALVDINNVALNSSEAVKSAMLNNFANFSSMVMQMVQNGILNFDQFVSYMKGVASFTSGASGYKPDLTPAFSSGGGGGGGESAEQKKIKNQIKALEDKKKALQDLIDDYNDYIDQQKELLKLQKEEKEFTDELINKNKSLARLKSDIAILALDDSEEAKAKRLKMEEDAAELEEEIVKDTEDRKYDLQIEMLDRLQKDYEDKIKRQMDLLDGKIEKLNEESSALSSVGGGVDENIDKTIELGQVSDEVLNVIISMLAQQMKLSDANKLKLEATTQAWRNQGSTIDEIIRKAWDYANVLAITKTLETSQGSFNVVGTEKRSPYVKKHNGGLIESHHDGDFAGGLKSNEVFAKLLKGEYVATEGQMNTFLQKTLPSMLGTPLTSKVNGNGDITVSMPINVAGSLDKSVIPDIKKVAEKVMQEINGAMKQRGYIRQTSTTSI